MISTSSIVLALVAAAPVFADLGKQSLWPRLHDPLSGLDNLPYKTFTYSQVDEVPSICTSHADDAGCDTSKVEAYQATLGDCSEPWTLCRCADAQME